MKKTLLVEGMSCVNCENAVKNALGELSNVSNVNVDLGSKKLEVEGKDLEDSILKKAVEEKGYDVVEIL